MPKLLKTTEGMDKALKEADQSSKKCMEQNAQELNSKGEGPEEKAPPSWLKDVVQFRTQGLSHIQLP